jgi:hypothetical protein
MEEFFVHNHLRARSLQRPDLDAANAELGALLLRYLHDGFNDDYGAWIEVGRDERAALRSTCHAAEALHKLAFGSATESMAQKATFWLTYLPEHTSRSAEDLRALRRHSSRFKTLAYLGHFEDAQLQRDFRGLLALEENGLLQSDGESSVLTTCVALDTLLNLRGRASLDQPFPMEQCERILQRLHDELRMWHTQQRQAARAGEKAASARKSLIGNARDLSYAMGLLLTAERPLNQTLLTAIKRNLLSGLRRQDWLVDEDVTPALYTLLQLAQWFPDDPGVSQTLRDAFQKMHAIYGDGAAQNWSFMAHTLTLRLLATHYGPERFRSQIASYLLEHERKRNAQHSQLNTELARMVRARMELEITKVDPLTGGYSDDDVYAVEFSYNFPLSDGRSGPIVAYQAPAPRLIVKRSSRDSFIRASQNYSRLPAETRSLFVRQPAEEQIYRSQETGHHFLIMEDLTDLLTLHRLLRRWDYGQVSGPNERLLGLAVERICGASFAMLESASQGRHEFHTMQISRLYLAQIEEALMRATRSERVPWLKNLVRGGCRVNEQQYQPLDHYLNTLLKQRQRFQPRMLGLTHGDFHARNIMLSKDCEEIKLIDLDKLSWSGDYIADLGTLVENVVIYRRLEYRRQDDMNADYSLSAEDIHIDRKGHMDGEMDRGGVKYPTLARPLTLRFQEMLLAQVGAFARQRKDTDWKLRLWMATATALFRRLAYQTRQKPAAVLYGEGLRLLHELYQFLEHGQALPALPVPATRPAAQPPTDRLPDWMQHTEQLRVMHRRLVEMGLQASVSASAARYLALIGEARKELVAVLAQPDPVARETRGALGVLLLRLDDVVRLPRSSLEPRPVVGRNEGALRTKVEITPASIVSVFAEDVAALVGLARDRIRLSDNIGAD